jgi:hypothetical protein
MVRVPSITEQPVLAASLIWTLYVAGARPVKMPLFCHDPVFKRYSNVPELPVGEVTLIVPSFDPLQVTFVNSIFAFSTSGSVKVTDNSEELQ